MKEIFLAIFKILASVFVPKKEAVKTEVIPGPVEYAEIVKPDLQNDTTPPPVEIVAPVEAVSVPEKSKFSKVDEIRVFQLYFEKNGIKENTAPFKLNICGIRKSYQITNKFDDVFVIWCYDESGEIQYMIVDGTTKSGITYARDIDLTEHLTQSRALLNSEGVAIIAEGYHKNVWFKGTHKGKPALRQCGTFKGYRDKNLDMRFDLNTLIDLPAACFINMHPSSENDNDEKEVGGWSAACQVYEKISDWRKFWSWVQKDILSEVYSYCLLNMGTVEKLLNEEKKQ